MEALNHELLRIVDPDFFYIAEIDGTPEAVFMASPDYNELLRLNADQYAEKKRDAFCSITVLSGRGEISYGSEKYIVVKKGRTYFLPAAMGEWRLRSDKEMVAYIARPGL